MFLCLHCFLFVCVYFCERLVAVTFSPPLILWLCLVDWVEGDRSDVCVCLCLCVRILFSWSKKSVLQHRGLVCLSALRNWPQTAMIVINNISGHLRCFSNRESYKSILYDTITFNNWFVHGKKMILNSLSTMVVDSEAKLRISKTNIPHFCTLSA